ncbi:MAG: TadE/TadG family type IV pilus assembly protein, partial [Paracoccaceae bacterium]
MTCRAHIVAWRAGLARRMRNEEGGVLVEFAFVIALFLFLFFTLLDFGRLAYSIVMAEKASALAARTAIVRPAACAGVPERHTRGTVPI